MTCVGIVLPLPTGEVLPTVYFSHQQAVILRSRRAVRTRRRDNAVLWTVFGISVLAALLTLAATRLTAPSLPPAAGPTFPRVPMLPQSPAELLRLVRIGTLTWYASILSAPLFVLLSRRVSFDRRGWPLALAAFAGTILTLACATSFAQYHLTYSGAPVVPPLRAWLLATGTTALLPITAVAAAAQALDARLRAREHELEASRMRTQLVEARLGALTAQLQPHFLFNTLQNISALIRADAERADRMLAQLSELLRVVLQRGERREVTLAEELAVLQPYLDISQTRFGSRLTIDIEADGATRGACVPFFVLQPLVENALEHGVGTRAGPGTVRITAVRAAERLRLTVSDDGPGMAAASRPGVGLANTAERLRQLYGAAATLELRNAPAGGTDVVIELPFRTEASA